VIRYAGLVGAGSCGFVDSDLSSCIWQDLLAVSSSVVTYFNFHDIVVNQVAVCPYLVDKNNQRFAGVNAGAGGRHVSEFQSSVQYSDEEISWLSGYIGVGSGPLGLQLSVDIFLVVAKIADLLRLDNVVDTMILLLAEFSGLIKVDDYSGSFVLTPVSTICSYFREAMCMTCFPPCRPAYISKNLELLSILCPMHLSRRPCHHQDQPPEPATAPAPI
jgi:hypothetical protein